MTTPDNMSKTLPVLLASLILTSTILQLSGSVLDRIPSSEADATPTTRILDATQLLMTGTGEFDRTRYRRMRECMASLDPLLEEAQDAGWQGFTNYWASGGAPRDAWGGVRGLYKEHNATVTTLDGMVIYEPCNYASNLAYYHVVTEFCAKRDAGVPFHIPTEYLVGISKSFSALTLGSSFMHGSNTKLGGEQDTRTLSVVAYLIHQASLSGLPPSTILHDLSLVPRKKSGLGLANDFDLIYLSMPVSEWRSHVRAMDLPEYQLSFTGFITTILHVSFSSETVDFMVPLLARPFGVPDAYTTFILESYLPELRQMVPNAPLPFFDSIYFYGDIFGAMVKMIYAFLWQERILTNNPFFLNPDVNEAGWFLLPFVNHYANKVSSFEHYQAEFQAAKDVYPGETWCNPVIPHAKWHVESAIALVDFTYLADELHHILEILS